MLKPLSAIVLALVAISSVAQGRSHKHNQVKLSIALPKAVSTCEKVTLHWECDVAPCNVFVVEKQAAPVFPNNTLFELFPDVAGKGSFVFTLGKAIANKEIFGRIQNDASRNTSDVTKPLYHKETVTRNLKVKKGKSSKCSTEAA